MEHAKKMVLIPLESMKRLQRITNDAAPGSTALSSSEALDEEMKKILNLRGKDNAEKWKLYQQVLQRYLFFTAEERKPLQLEVIEQEKKKPKSKSVAESVATENKPTKSEDISVSDGVRRPVDNILDNVPTKYHGRAKRLMHLLNAAPTRFTWDRDGVIRIDGIIVPNTNITELVNHTLRFRKHVEPAGALQFARFLHDINVPHEYVSNETFWKHIRAFDNVDIADAASLATALAMSTPVKSPTRKRSRSSWRSIDNEKEFGYPFTASVQRRSSRKKPVVGISDAGVARQTRSSWRRLMLSTNK